MTPFERYIAPAAERLGWWRPVAGMVLILGAWILGVVIIVFGWTTLQALITGDLNTALAGVEDLTAGGDSVSIMVILLTFAGIWFGTAVAMQGFHDLPLSRVFGPRGSGGFWRGLALGLGFSAVSLGVAVAFVGTPVQAQSVAEWAPLALPILALIFVQATGEELIFRGYLLQQIAVRASHPVFWAVLPSLGFGLMHYSGTLPGAGGIYYVAITAVLGIALAAIVWRAGSLWPAAGVHVGINAGSLLFVGADGILSGPQLWLFQAEDVGRLFAVDLALCIGLLLVVLSPAGRWIAPARLSGIR